jgi:hypothetical protein
LDDGGFDAGEFGEFGGDVLQVEEELVDDLVVELLDLSHMKKLLNRDTFNSKTFSQLAP